MAPNSTTRASKIRDSGMESWWVMTSIWLFCQIAVRCLNAIAEARISKSSGSSKSWCRTAALRAAATLLPPERRRIQNFAHISCSSPLVHVERTLRNTWLFVLWGCCGEILVGGQMIFTVNGAHLNSRASKFQQVVIFYVTTWRKLKKKALASHTVF